MKNNVADLQEFKKKRARKEFDISRLTPYYKERLDFFLDVHKLGLVDRLTYDETMEMRRLIDFITVNED